MKKIQNTLPIENVEYTFLQPDGKTFNAYILLGKLANGRYFFSGRTVTGNNKSARWTVSMTENRFSYLYAKCRSPFYPDTYIDNGTEDSKKKTSYSDIYDKTKEYKEEREKERLKGIEEQKRNEEVARNLRNLSAEQRRFCNIKNLDVDVISEVLLNKKETKDYALHGERILRLMLDCQTISKITGADTRLIDVEIKDIHI